MEELTRIWKASLYAIFGYFVIEGLITAGYLIWSGNNLKIAAKLIHHDDIYISIIGVAVALLVFINNYLKGRWR